MREKSIVVNLKDFIKTDLFGISENIIHNDASDIVLNSIPLIKKDSYKIFINQGKTNIIGTNDSSIRYGLNHFLSLEDKYSSRIIDEDPRYEHRELMLDVARHFFDINEIKKIIDEMFVNKINYLHLHLSDDQGFRIESDNYPLLNECEQYTKDEIKELVRYASLKNVEIIPEIDIPGHMNYVLSKYPELKNENNKLLSVNKKETFDFITNLIGEISNLFSSDYFHIGADEYYGKNYKDVSNFINYVSKFLSSLGKKVIMWNDALKYPNIDESIIVQKWYDFFDNNTLIEFRRGRKFIFGSTLDTYFDYPLSLINIKKTYDYVPKIKQNEVSGLNILGISSHIWTENISTNEKLEHNLFPRLNAFGENAWLENSKKDYNNFLFRIKKEIEILQKRGINSASYDEITTYNEEDIISYFIQKCTMDYPSTSINYLTILKLTLDLLKDNKRRLEILTHTAKRLINKKN